MACGFNDDVFVKEAVTEEAVVAEKCATEKTTINSAVFEEAVAEEAAKEVEKLAKAVSNTPDRVEWADLPMVVEDSFYASKPVFRTSVSRGLLARKKVAVKEDDVEDDAKAAPKPAVDTAKPDGDVDEIYLSSPPSHLGADACRIKNDVAAKSASAEAFAAKSAADEEDAEEATAEEAATEEATTEEAAAKSATEEESDAKDVEKLAKTVSNTPDTADTTCFPSLPAPKEVGKSGPAPARSGSGPGYVDGVEAEVRRLCESVVYQATPADGNKSPSLGVPTSCGIAPVAPNPLGAGAGQAEAAAAKEREHWEGIYKKAKAALDLKAEQRKKWEDSQSRRSQKCRRKARRWRKPKTGKSRGRKSRGRKSRGRKSRGRGRRPDRRRELQTSGKAPFAAGTCGTGAGTCGAGGRAGLKAAADCVRRGYTKAEGALRGLLLVCMPAFGHCAPAVPSPTGVASAFSSAVSTAASVASSASSTISSGVASAASSAFSAAVASKAASLVSCSPLLMPALVLTLLAIACGTSWPTAASGKGARRGVAWAVFAAAAAACIPGAAAASVESSASSTAFSWFTEGGAIPLSFLFAVSVFAATADLVLRWRSNSTAAFSPPVMSPPPSPPESGGGPSAVMTSFDDNDDGVIDAKEAVDVAEDIANKVAAEREAQKEAARERKISQVFRRFALVLLLALLASVGINAALTAGIVIATKDTKVGGDGLLVSSETGEVLKVSSADFGVKAIVAPERRPDVSRRQLADSPFTDTATVSVLVDANGGAVSTASAVNENSVLVDSRGGAVKTEAAEYYSQFGAVDLVDDLLGRTTVKQLDGIRKLRLLSDGVDTSFAIQSWTIRAFSVVGMPSLNELDFDWQLMDKDGGRVDKAEAASGETEGEDAASGPTYDEDTDSVALRIRVLLLETNRARTRGIAVIKFYSDDPTAPWRTMQLISAEEADQLSMLLLPTGDDEPNLNYIMDKIVLKGHDMRELRPGNSASPNDGRRLSVGRRLFINVGLSLVGIVSGSPLLQGPEVPLLQAVGCAISGGVASVLEDLLTRLVQTLTDAAFKILDFACDTVNSGLNPLLDLIAGQRVCFPCEQEKEFDLLNSPAVYLKAKVQTPKVCMTFLRQGDLVDCGKLMEYLEGLVDSWLEKQVIDPVVDWADDIQAEIGCRRRLHEEEGGRRLKAGRPQNKIEAFAEKALLKASGDGHRRLYALQQHGDHAGESSALLRDLFRDALSAAETMMGEEMVQSLTEHYRPQNASVGGRKLEELSGGNDNSATDLAACTGECDSDAQCAAGLLCFQRSNGEMIPGCYGPGGGSSWDYCYYPALGAPGMELTKSAFQLNLEFEAGVTLTATAETSLVRSLQVDLVEELLGKPMEFDVATQYPLISPFLSLGLAASGGFKIPLQVVATFDAAAEVVAEYNFKRTFVVAGDRSSERVSAKDEVIEVTASGGVSATLYATISAEANFQIEVQLVLLSGLAMLYANAAASWNPRAGAGAVVCASAGGEACPLLSTNDADAEYDPASPAGLSLQYGAWMYVPMPRLEFGAGIRAGNEFAKVLECNGVGTEWKPVDYCVFCNGETLASFAQMEYLSISSGESVTRAITHDAGE